MVCMVFSMVCRVVGVLGLNCLGMLMFCLVIRVKLVLLFSVDI